ncbi:MAG TPA: DNA recombination protein RmuC, partial [Candidatus Nanoarchaeia archaeon]|nr:DNA recombination protein RmuC [Candidatus Nanoarchaeia archaeon]
MSDIPIPLILVGGGFLGVFLFLLWQKRGGKQDASFLILQDQLERLTRTMDERLRASQTDLHQVLSHQDSEAKKLITDITRELTEVKESNKQVFSIAEQLHNLEKVLKHQKQRGNLGEASLELILANILPPGVYKMQHQFKNGETVDAIIQTKDGIIPVDAKFSLDNYTRIINEKDDARR